MGTPGVGTSLHLGGELFKMMAGVDMVHVPTRGGGATLLTDVLGGQVHVIFGTSALSIELIRAGRLRPLAVTTARRWAGLPDIPTVSEFVPGYDASSILGLARPGILRCNHRHTQQEVGAAFAIPKFWRGFPT
jgi:tripartite-type tricarboxylate transporter receptor subunit TctC